MRNIVNFQIFIQQKTQCPLGPAQAARPRPRLLALHGRAEGAGRLCRAPADLPRPRLQHRGWETGERGQTPGAQALKAGRVPGGPGAGAREEDGGHVKAEKGEKVVFLILIWSAPDVSSSAYSWK